MFLLFSPFFCCFMFSFYYPFLSVCFLFFIFFGTQPIARLAPPGRTVNAVYMDDDLVTY